MSTSGERSGSQPAARGPEAVTPDLCSETLYRDLHRLAALALRNERLNHTLSPTALIHEAWLRVARGQKRWSRRAEFCAAIAVTMRRVLVDHARARLRLKRGGQHQRLLLSTRHMTEEEPTPHIDILALHEAIENLATISPERARVVELRYFGGLDVEDIAAALDLSPATVRRYWASARAWLQARLSEAGS